MPTIRLPLLALLGLPAATLTAQVEVNGGDVKIRAGDTQISSANGDVDIKAASSGKARIDASHDGSAHIDAGAAASGGARSRQNVHGANVNGVIVNAAHGTDAVSEQTIDGHTTTTTGNSRIVTSNGVTTVTGDGTTQATASSGAASVPGVVTKGVHSYANGELANTNFSGQALVRVSFANATLTEADFSRADLRGADFANAGLARARFAGANLTGANLANAELEDTDFSGAIWTDGRVCGAGSRGACR